MFEGIISSAMQIPPAERLRLGFLYPRGGSSHEYYQFAEAMGDNIRCYLIGGMHAFGGAKTHYPSPLFEMESIENLSYPTRSMRPLNVHAAMWSTTSASFIGGLKWSLAQSAALTDILGSPVSSTGLAFIAAIHALGLKRVAVLASYPQEVTNAFRAFLGEADIAVSDYIHLDADAGEDAFNFTIEFLVERARQLDLSKAEALLVPDTAMAAFGLMRQLEAMLGVPVLTANQVTIWKCLQLAGAQVETAQFGALYQRAGALTTAA